MLVSERPLTLPDHAALVQIPIEAGTELHLVQMNTNNGVVFTCPSAAGGSSAPRTRQSRADHEITNQTRSDMESCGNSYQRLRERGGP